MRKNDLSDAEKEIMDFMWSKNMRGVTLRDITQYFNNELGRNWKQQAIRVFLDRLKEKGYIHIYIDTETNRYVYTPKDSKENYLKNVTKKFLNNFFNGSVYDFLSAFTGGEKLSKEEAEELKKFLEE